MKNKSQLKKAKKEDFEKAFGSWKDANIKDSVEYVRKIRKEWEKRIKRLRIK